MYKSGLLDTIYCPILGRVKTTSCRLCRFRYLCGRGN